MYTRMKTAGYTTAAWKINAGFCQYVISTKISHAGQSKQGCKIRNRYNQVSHLTQDTNGKVTNAQLDFTNESEEVNPFPAGDHKAHINRRAQTHSNHKTEKSKRSTKEVLPLERSVKYFTGFTVH